MTPRPEDRKQARELLDDHAHDDHLVDRIASALTQARANSAMKWIPTSERVPENGARVLGIHPPSGNVYIYCFDYGVWETDDETQIRQPEFHPRFWMPLPAPPEGAGT